MFIEYIRPYVVASDSMLQVV